ncbi:peptidoglycan D,D-transpeptidase FtsI family protein [Arenibaculum pallidiluteum]|uniref:peptidoglycan D,D-transpeptidase FtsI family protein n=1 Tax=Arenibaculum pallidiluteum TaxID=2812559 RepID=UPI001A96B2AF|nr:penicillin-binding protein 2 [Arenibaculum pallidiluteum]
MTGMVPTAGFGLPVRVAPRPNRAVHALEQGRARLSVAMAAFGMAFVGISLGLVNATVLRQSAEPDIAQAAPARTLQASRADIVDRNGVVLATSLVTQSLYADPKLVINPVEAAEKLTAALTDLDYGDVLQKLKADKRFVWIKRNLSPRESYIVNRLGIPGVAFQREERRVYPQGSLAAHVVGFTGVDNNGLMGIEQSFDKELRGSTEAVNLSLDVRLQHIMRRELKGAVEEFSAIGGAGMIFDIRTGEILSMVSLPDFDPHDPVGLDENTRFNRNTLGVYEMGSTFKIFNSALAFETGRITPTSHFDASRPIQVGRYTISDYHGKNRVLSVAEVFQYSSNIGSVRMVLEAGVPAQRALLTKLGLTSKPTLEIPEVGAPMVPNPWREINAMTISFGHGLSVSPLQVVTATAAVVNGGIMRHPTILKRNEAEPMSGERVVSPATSMLMRKMMRLVVTEGTAGGAKAEGYVVGGKTGTAEKITGRGYNAKARMSSFVGAFPINDPRYVILVILDEPKGIARTGGYATGGAAAAPLGGRVIRQVAPLLGLTPVDENRPDIRQALDITAPPPRSSLLASH